MSTARAWTALLTAVHTACLMGACRTAGPVRADLSVMHDKPDGATLVAFERDGRWGYRNPDGREVIAPRFVIAQEFSAEGIAAVVDERGWVYIDRRGETLVRPLLLDNGPDYFQEGLARHVDDGRIGFFDSGGRVVIPARFDHAAPFSEGLAAVCSGCRKVKDGEHTIVQGGRWGYIDRSGKLIIEQRYERASGFREGRARVRQGGKELAIDRQGRQIRWP